TAGGRVEAPRVGRPADAAPEPAGADPAGGLCWIDPTRDHADQLPDPARRPGLRSGRQGVPRGRVLAEGPDPGRAAFGPDPARQLDVQLGHEPAAKRHRAITPPAA